MPAPVKSFLACQIVTLHMEGFSKIADELGLKANSTTQSVYNFYHRNDSFLPKKQLVDHQSYPRKPRTSW